LHRRIYLDGWADVPVHGWDQLTPDAEIVGPAIFESTTTTAVARAGDQVRVTPHGWLDIRIDP
jgi:N-methylhydantoinase A/oxoprolinase/acetone carboxylase beta subunit